MEQHVYPWTVVSVSLHYEYPAKRVGFVQRGHHHLNKCSWYRNDMPETNYSFVVKQ
jgi:hypothetical protein